MAEFDFQRDCRTPHSEAYTILDGETPIGHLDLHYTDTLVHATLCVAERLTEEDIRELVEFVDDELVSVLGVSREEFIVHVFQGRDVGVFSDQDFGPDGGEEEPEK